jgi:hypothetical protein
VRSLTDRRPKQFRAAPGDTDLLRAAIELRVEPIRARQGPTRGSSKTFATSWRPAPTGVPRPSRPRAMAWRGGERAGLTPVSRWRPIRFVSAVSKAAAVVVLMAGTFTRHKRNQSPIGGAAGSARPRSHRCTLGRLAHRRRP